MIGNFWIQNILCHQLAWTHNLWLQRGGLIVMTATWTLEGKKPYVLYWNDPSYWWPVLVAVIFQYLSELRIYEADTELVLTIFWSFQYKHTNTQTLWYCHKHWYLIQTLMINTNSWILSSKLIFNKKEILNTNTKTSYSYKHLYLIQKITADTLNHSCLWTLIFDYT